MLLSGRGIFGRAGKMSAIAATCMIACCVYAFAGCRSDTKPVYTETEQWLTAGDGNKIYTKWGVPVGATGKLPAIIYVSGGFQAGTPCLSDELGIALFQAGYAVVTFNVEGRGSGDFGDLTSEGVDDYNGHIAQDDLKTVLDAARNNPSFDPGRIGILSRSFGVSIAAGCLARFADDPAVKNVRFLIDTEGPSDNYALAGDAWLLDAYAENDKTQTQYELFHHYSVHYDENYLHLSSSEVMADAEWWAEREALKYIGLISVPYMRLQSEWDHMQPPDATYKDGFDHPPLWYPRKHVIDMVNGATNGSSPWTRVNASAMGNTPNTTYSQESQPAFYSGSFHTDPSGYTAIAVQAVAEMFSLTL